MVLEWLRRNMPTWNAELKDDLFTGEPIAELETRPHD